MYLIKILAFTPTKQFFFTASHSLLSKLIGISLSKMFSEQERPQKVVDLFTKKFDSAIVLSFVCVRHSLQRS